MLLVQVIVTTMRMHQLCVRPLMVILSICEPLESNLHDLILTQFHMQIALMVRLALNKVKTKLVEMKLWEDLKCAVTMSGFLSITPSHGIEEIQ